MSRRTDRTPWHCRDSQAFSSWVITPVTFFLSLERTASMLLYSLCVVCLFPKSVNSKIILLGTVCKATCMCVHVCVCLCGWIFLCERISYWSKFTACLSSCLPKKTVPISSKANKRRVKAAGSSLAFLKQVELHTLHQELQGWVWNCLILGQLLTRLKNNFQKKNGTFLFSSQNFSRKPKY